MVKFWIFITFGILAYLVLGANTELFELSKESQTSWVIALVYCYIQIDLAKLEQKLELLERSQK